MQKITSPCQVQINNPSHLRSLMGNLDKPDTERATAGSSTDKGLKTRGAVITQQDFSESDLSGAGLSGFKFWQVKFAHARLVETDLRNASLNDVDFQQADFAAQT